MELSRDCITCRIFFTILILLIQIPVLAQDSASAEDLFEMDIEELMNVEVTSFSKRSEKSSKAPGTVYVWTEEQIKTYGFRNLQDVLEATPGFEITNFYFWLNGGQRGYNNNMAGTLVLVNGRRMMMEFFKEAYIMEQYPLEMIKRIEIIQGPISVLYGSKALQGIINIITKGDGDYPDTASLETRFGSFNSKATTVNFRKNYSQESFVWVAVSMHETDNPDLSNFVDDLSRFSRKFDRLYQSSDSR
jgi:outer membrane receptor for ferrienterochelin and colicin